LAVCLAIGQAGFSPFMAFLAVIGVVLTHMGVNLFDDYFDYRHQNTIYRDLMAREGMRARIAKCPYLTSGKATVRELFIVCVIFWAMALLAAIIILIARGTPILWLIVATFILGITYSGWPLRLSYRGLGELEIGAVFGPLMMSGVYYSACGEFNPSLLLIAIPVGLLVMNIVYAHAIMDVEPDKRVGKMTLAVLAGGHLARLTILALVLAIPYALVGLGVAFKSLSPAYLLVWLTFPLAFALFKLMRQFASDPTKPVARRFWMGPMSRWERVKANGIEWFMVRWFLARNLLLFFCLTCVLARVIS
jgi:1,4-dihydroxy-2-naphthoate octaprenyltransferase